MATLMLLTVAGLIFYNLNIGNYNAITVNGGSYNDVGLINGTSINVYNSTLTDIDGSQLTNTQIGSYLYNSTGDCYHNNLTGYDIAIWATSNSSYTCSNTKFCDNSVDLLTSGGGYIYAEDDTMSAPWPQSIDGNIGGYCDEVCPQLLAKTIAEVDDHVYTDYPEELDILNKKHAELLFLIYDENRGSDHIDFSRYVSLFEPLIDGYKGLLNEQMNADITTAVLSKLEKMYTIIQKDKEFKSLLHSLLESKYYSELTPYIERYFVNLHVKSGNYTLAIQTADDILSQSTIDEKLTCELLYEEGLIYKYHLNNAEKAEQLFTQIIEKYPGNELNIFVMNELGEEGKLVERGKQTEETEEVKEVCLNSYPNPFNPTTNITFSLPNKGRVTIMLYDILGREVAELTNGTKEAGTYSIQFNGSRLASGLYILTMKVNDLENGQTFSKSQKLLLTK